MDIETISINIIIKIIRERVERSDLLPVRTHVYISHSSRH